MNTAYDELVNELKQAGVKRAKIVWLDIAGPVAITVAGEKQVYYAKKAIIEFANKSRKDLSVVCHGDLKFYQCRFKKFQYEYF